MKYTPILGIAAILSMAFACSQNNTQEPIKEEINLMIKAEQVAEHKGQPVFHYLLDNGTMQVELSNYGGWGTSSALVGCMVGAGLCIWISDRLGRKRLLIFSGFLFSLSVTSSRPLILPKSRAWT